MHLFIEKVIRGGVAMISHRFSSANNPCLANYVPTSTSPNLYIMYWHANNLYEWTMSQHLPTHDFSWTQENVDYMNIPDDSGYILEIDLEYPPERHHHQNCYPLTPEKIIVGKTQRRFMRLQPPRRLSLFSAASFSDVTRDGSAIYRYSAAAGGPQ
ncbi:hypothetical protein AVEN_73996-1 [Araneus ventricosus]|uniref:Uncharacterized protein n=1 Tax=Araneus ventricosus TaxID=182803 RepID=A0A4Y2NQP3_ARAVE|nr:hypothetical protein AVEN_73996-1 [Araneus ventricosus]